MIYEIKTYIPAPGKAAALRNRLMIHTVPLLARHGIEVVAVMAPAESADDLVYITRGASQSELQAAWKRFMADEQWQAIKAESEKDGPLLQSQTTQVFHGLAPLAA